MVAEEGYASLAWQLAAVIAVLLFLLLVQILVMRMLIARRRGRERSFRSLWEPVLARCGYDVPMALPVLDRRDVALFLTIWNHLQESLRDAATDRLNELARRVGADQAAIELVRSRGVRERLIAITALGHLHEVQAWDQLVSLMRSGDTALSMAAARALVRIDAVRGAELTIPAIGKRPDWPTATVAAMLQDAGPDAVSTPLEAAIEAASHAEAPRLIRLLQFATPDVAGRVVRRLLVEDAPAEVAIACLRIVEDPTLLDRVRGRVHDVHWQVRLHAVQALGRLGTRADEPLLVEAVGDPQWWVRYRAAQALASLPLIEIGHVEELADTHADRFGRDILRQVLAEKELAS